MRKLFGGDVRRQPLPAGSGDFCKPKPMGGGAKAAGRTVTGWVPPLPQAINAMSSSFNLNGTTHTVEHEVRTTLWEVISEQIGLTGTVRSCNRATCGVCTVVIDGTPIYSCHMLAHEAA